MASIQGSAYFERLTILAGDLDTHKLWNEAMGSAILVNQWLYFPRPMKMPGTAHCDDAFHNRRFARLSLSWRCLSCSKICPARPICGDALHDRRRMTGSAYCGDAFHDRRWCLALPIVAMPSPFEDDAWIGLIVAMRCLSRPKTMPNSAYCGECSAGFGERLIVKIAMV